MNIEVKAATYWDEHFRTNSICHIRCENELELDQLADILHIPVERMHKTVTVSVWIHDATPEEIKNIQSRTLGNLKGRLKQPIM